MTPVAPVDAAMAGQPAIMTLGVTPIAAPSPSTIGFGDILSAGMRNVDQKLATADDLVRRFTLNEDVPIHQVTYALEQAKLSVELAMQVRSRLLDGYREIMNMQL